MAHTVLVVEDEEDLAFPLIRTLEREGYEVRAVSTGSQAVEALRSPTAPDVVLLDLGLPDIDGLEVCRGARAAGYEGAILILTARAGELDRVVGLDYGADDYLAKPFSVAELLARVRALLRRTGVNGTAQASPAGSIRIDVAGHRVYAGETEVTLTAKEFQLLVVLVSERDRVVQRDRLMAEVWDQNWYGSTKTLDVTIGRLRTKLAQAGVTDRVVAVRGVGFRLESGS